MIISLALILCVTLAKLDPIALVALVFTWIPDIAFIFALKD